MKESSEGLVPARAFLQSAMAPRPSFNDGWLHEDLPVMIDAHTKIQLPSLRTPPSQYNKHIRYTLYEFPILLDSSSISADGWTSIAETIQNNYEHYDGFVVLHGTDSLSYTCSALSFMFDNLGKPIILTGAQSSIFSLQSDATTNLLGSLIIAGTFNIPEVLLFFNNTLFRGNRTMKISATDYDAFASPNMPPLATINSSSTKIDWHLIRRSTTIAPLSVQKNLNTAYVACLRIFPGITPEMVDAVLNIPKLKGLILETFGAGNAPDVPPTPFSRPGTPSTPNQAFNRPSKSLLNVIKSAVKRGTIIVNVSSCPSGTVSPTYAPGHTLGKAGVVFGHDLTTEAALTKLSYLLALPNMTNEKICKAIGTNLRGEITEVMTPHFKHPDIAVSPTLQSAQSAFAALGYAIAANDFASVEALLALTVSREENSSEVIVKTSNLNLLNESDYCGNTALHLVALMGSLEMLEALLKKGANVHARNSAGNTPLFLAAREGRREQGELLRKAGGLLGAEEKEKTERKGGEVWAPALN